MHLSYTPLLCASIKNMLYKKYTVSAVFAILLISLLSCGGSRHSGKSKNFMPGTWQATPIVVDGDSKDWPSPYPNFDAKAEVAYATSNDKENLYITMETGDEMTQMKILKQGMIVSIDTSGGKDAEFHINFPLPNDSDPIDMPQSAHKTDPGSMQGKQLDVKLSKSAKDANQFSLDGFNACNGGYMVSQTTPCGVKVIARIDEYKELVWEAVVPFKAIYNKDVITPQDADKPISVCFVIKGFKNPASKNNDAGGNGISNNTGGTGANIGGRGGGGGRGKGAGTRPAENPLQHLYESTKTWKQFDLVYKQ